MLYITIFLNGDFQTACDVKIDTDKLQNNFPLTATHALQSPAFTYLIYHQQSTNSA